MIYPFQLFRHQLYTDHQIYRSRHAANTKDQNHTNLPLFKPKDIDPLIEFILLLELMFLVESVLDIFHHLITSILDLVLHKIFNP